MSFNSIKKLPSIGKMMDIEEGENARERHVARQHITWTLRFVNPIDEQLYRISLKNLFYFPTFWPIMFVFMAFIVTQNGVLEEIQGGDVFIAVSFACNIFNVSIILIFTICQCIDYFSTRAPSWMIACSRFFLRKLLSGRMEDIVVLLLATALGFYQISLISRDMCTACGTVFEIEKCIDGASRNFPMVQGLIGYLSLLMINIYFKSINRHMVFLAWAILTVFIIAAHLYGHYPLRFVTVMMVIFFFVSMVEYERYKMTSYLLSKEALSLEKSKLFIMQEKSKIIERKLHMALVHQILPPKVAEQIIAGKQVAPESFEEVTIFFSDVEGFTTICSQVAPAEVVKMLNNLYTVMDYCTSLFPVYKVETIGDAYMLVGGLPVRDPNHAQAIADFALLVRHAVNSVKSPVDGSSIRIRIGLHSGPVMAGVVGNLMPRYCLFGDTVNTASRMESNGQPGLIHCSEKTATILLASGKHKLTTRGEIDVKGKGRMTTFWLDCASEDNTQSNDDAIAKCQRMVEDLLAPSDDGVVSPSLLQAAAAGFDGESVFGTVAGEIDEEHLESVKSQLAQMQFDGGTGASGAPGTQPSPHGAAAGGALTPRQQAYQADSAHGALTPTKLPARGLRHVASVGSRPGASPAVSSASLEGLGPLSAVSSGVFDSSGAKILVVEDSVAQRKMLIKRLSEADASWDVSAAVSGEDALAKLKAARYAFDVVFVDENLSVSDGLFGHELVQVMRESYHMKHTIIIACTSNPAKVGKDLLEAGVDFVWPKPPPLASVIKTKINMLLEARLKQIIAQNNGTAQNSASNSHAGSSSASHAVLSPRLPTNFNINLNFLRSFTSGTHGAVHGSPAKVHPV